MSTAKIRTILRNHYGRRQYRITRDGEIHVYGQMPNSIESGWWLYGHIADRDTLIQLAEIAA